MLALPVDERTDPMTAAVTHLPDISEYQKQMTVTDWQRLFNEQHRRYGSSGAAIVRIDYGDAHVDRHLANRATAHKAGVKVLGLYQYGVDGQPVHLQAEAFTGLVGKLLPGEFAVYDLEEGHGDLHTTANLWFAEVDHDLHYPGYSGAWLYSGESFYREHDLAAAMHGRHGWIAAYRTRPEPFIAHTLWQHTNGQVGNTLCQPWPVIGRVDCSIYHGTVDQLRALVAGSAAGPKLTVKAENRGYFTVAWTEDAGATYDVYLDGRLIATTRNLHYSSNPIGRLHGRHVVRVLSTGPSGRVWSNAEPVRFP
jgi:hypothetical protein